MLGRTKRRLIRWRALLVVSPKAMLIQQLLQSPVLRMA
ncbi:MAG: hypothetical protein OJF52_001268 [Nitrospira sp.]|jgi:hypothetical protein|nr:MAG: hypothetical protein OJF52_001268 [Nitrospira sp.]